MAANRVVELTVGSHALAAAAHRGRSVRERQLERWGAGAFSRGRAGQVRDEHPGDLR